MGPKVSVIVPVYNCESYISECLKSILNQTYTNIEIIIVNDGSTDRSEYIINQYKKKYKKIKYFSQENKGPSEARNKAIINASGDYLVFIDSDDTVNKFYVEKLLNKMLYTNADIACCGYKDISIYGSHNHTDFKFEKEIFLHPFLEMVCEGTGGVLWGKIYKKEIILKNNIMLDKNIFMSEDLVFVLKYATHCRSFESLNEYLYNYNRLNQNSISTNISVDYLQNSINVCRHIEEILNNVEELDREIIKKIITRKIQDIVLYLIEQQSGKLKDIGMEVATQNLVEILSIEYIKNYKHNFTSKNIFYVPFLFLIKRNFYKTSIFYAFYLNYLRSLKNKFKKRK